MPKQPTLWVISPAALAVKKRSKVNLPQHMKDKIAGEIAADWQATESAIAAALAAVNGRATQFTITCAGQLRDIAAEAEAIMDRAGLAEKYRVGADVAHVPAGPYANAYKHAAISTRVTLTRKAGGAWTLAKAERVDVWPREKARTAVHISPAAAGAVARNALAPFVVRAAEATAVAA